MKKLSSKQKVAVALTLVGGVLGIGTVVVVALHKSNTNKTLLQ